MMGCNFLEEERMGNILELPQREAAIAALTTLQCAVVEMTTMSGVEGAVFSLEDIENANYVIGMATATAANLEKLLLTDELPEKTTVGDFISGAAAFAESFRSMGIGLSS